jgi:hypothetical protein
MKVEDYKKAKSVEEKIKNINHIISGLEKQSYYKLVLLCCGDDKTEEIVEHLGYEYMKQANSNLIDALTLKRLKLQEEFRQYISL